MHLKRFYPPADKEPVDEESTPPADEESTPPADEEPTPPADEEPTPPADEPIPPADEENFEQSKMREHLKKCFLRNRLECFPESRRRRRLGRHRFVATKPVDVFCKCRLTWNRVQNQLGDLIQCEICRKWCHEVCEGVDRTKFEHPKNHWYCTKCFSF